MSPPNDRKLRIQFQKSLRKGFVMNALLDPEIYGFVKRAAEPNESFIVRVDRKQGGSYWFSDRRVLLEDVNAPRELLRYENVRRTHWMFKGGLRNPIMLSRGSSAKHEHYDRIEIEVGGGLVVLEGLGQAYVPTLHFFQWISD
jgi:hypothetical protein